MPPKLLINARDPSQYLQTSLVDDNMAEDHPFPLSDVGAMSEIAKLLDHGGHPKSDRGWFCCSSFTMRALIPQLAANLNGSFRTAAVSQVQHCHQCAIRYHEIMEEWESGAALDYPLREIADIKEKLLSADTRRIMNRLGKKIYTSDETARKVQVATYIEIFGSVDLALRRPIIRALNANHSWVKTVLTHHVQTEEMQLVLPGLFAAAVLCEGNTQNYILNTLCVSKPPRNLHRVVDFAITFLAKASKSNTQPAFHVPSVCNGLSFVVKTCPLDSSHLLSEQHCQARLLLMDVIGRSYACAVSIASKLLRRLVLACPAQTWGTPEQANRAFAAILRCIRAAFTRMGSNPRVRTCLLRLYLTVVEAQPQTKICHDLMSDQLEFLLQISKNTEFGLVGKDAIGVIKLGRTVAAKVILHGYKCGAPIPPFRHAATLHKLLNIFLKDKSMTELSIALSAEILLTDACNVLRCILGKPLTTTVIRELGTEPLRILSKDLLDQTIYRCLCDVWQKDWLKLLDHKGPIPWMGTLWDMLYANNALVPYPTAVQKGLGEILFEVHRVVGLLSPSFRCAEGDLQNWDSPLTFSDIEPLKCLEKIQNTITRFLLHHKRISQPWWGPRLAYHSGHLLASRVNAIRVAASDFMVNVMHVDTSRDKGFHIMAAFQDDPDCAARAAEGILQTSRVLTCFELKNSFYEHMYHFIHYANAKRAKFFTVFAKLEGAQKVICMLLRNMFSDCEDVRARDNTYELWMERCLRQVRRLIDSLAGLGNIDVHYEVLDMIANMDCVGSDLRNTWVDTVREVSSKAKLTERLRRSYASVLRKSFCLLSEDQCLALVQELNLSEKTMYVVRARKQRESRQGTSQVTASRAPVPMSFVPKAPPVARPIVQSIVPRFSSTRLPVKRVIQKTSRDLQKFRTGAREKAERALLAALNRREPSKPKSFVEKPKPLHPLTPRERNVTLRFMDSFHAGVLHPNANYEGHRGMIVGTAMPTTFPDAEAYVKFWTPVLASEAKASVMQDAQAERAHFEKLARRDRCFVLAPFLLCSPMSRVNDMWELTLRFTGAGDIRTYGHDLDVDNKFKACSMQLADVLRLEVSMSPGDDDSNSDMLVSLGVVTKADVGRKKSVFTVQVPRGGSFPIIGEGRKVWVTRVTSLVSQQRQIQALWSASCLPERILRTMLRPDEGWTLAKEKNKGVIVVDPSLKKLRELGVVNASQADAVNVVLKKAGKLSGRYYSGRPQGTSSSSSSSLTLIQGPPGTGKTTTILALLSAMLSNSAGVLQNRMRMENMPNLGRIPVAPFRVLVCAPSNAAVDEILNRVMQRGLPMPNGGYASPRVVRIGTRSSIDENNQVELKTLSRMNPDWTSSKSEGEKENLEKIKEQEAVLRSIYSDLDDAHKQQRNARGLLSECRTAEERDELLVTIRKNNDWIESIRRHRDEIKGKIVLLRDQENNCFHERNNNNIRALMKTLNGASVVFCTLNGAGSEHMGHLIGSFDVVIVDEAAQCIEPDILIPLTGRRPNVVGQNGSGAVNATKSPPLARHCVLVGDPNQLPATVLSNDASVQAACGKSFFERAAESPHSEVHLLNMQYRMHPEICQFPSTQFYDGRLICGENVKDVIRYHKSYHFDAKKRFGPLTFLDTSHCTATREIKTRTNSLKNEGEARLIVMALVALFRLYPKEQLSGEIAVLSPYSAQVQELKWQIRNEDFLCGADIEVNTVDGIQGREKSIVVLSTVREGSGGIGFVKDQRRMNVGLTRAQHAVIVVGNSASLSAGAKDWADFVEHCNKKDRTVPVKISGELFPEARARIVKPASYLRGKLPDLSIQDWERRPTPKAVPKAKDTVIIADGDTEMAEAPRAIKAPILDLDALVSLAGSRNGTPSPTEASLSHWAPVTRKRKSTLLATEPKRPRTMTASNSGKVFRKKA